MVWLRCYGASLVALVLLLPSDSTGAEEVELKPRLRTGDEFSLKLIHTRENSSRPQQNGKSTSTIAVRVGSATPAGVTLEWTPRDVSFDNALVARDPMVTAAVDAMRGISLRVKLSPDGEFAGLTKQDEVLPRLQAAIDLIARELKHKVPEEHRSKFEAMMSSVLSPSMLIASATRDVQTYFGLSGATLAVGEPVEVEMQQPNPFGGEPIPARLRVRAESATKTEAVIKTTTTYEGAVLMRMTQALIAKAGQPLPPEEVAKLPAMKMEDEGRYVFDRKLGLMREGMIKRRIEADTQRRFDGWEIRLVKAPKR